jgi:hypothetical protein
MSRSYTFFPTSASLACSGDSFILIIAACIKPSEFKIMTATNQLRNNDVEDNITIDSVINKCYMTEAIHLSSLCER